MLSFLKAYYIKLNFLLLFHLFHYQYQESPLHQLGTINGLLAIAKKKSKRESLLAVDALQDLWLTTLLPDDRKLKLLAQV